MISYRDYVIHNKQAIEDSTECACIFCFERINPTDIDEYCDDYILDTDVMVEDTAVCPYCGIDSIIPNSLVKYTDEDLKKWHEEGFGEKNIHPNQLLK